MQPNNKRTQKPAATLSMDEWFAQQDRAVDVVHRRMKRKAKPAVEQKPMSIEQSKAKLTESLFEAFRKGILDTKNHDIYLSTEIIDKQLVRSIFINGMPLL